MSTVHNIVWTSIILLALLGYPVIKASSELFGYGQPLFWVAIASFAIFLVAKAVKL